MGDRIIVFADNNVFGISNVSKSISRRTCVPLSTGGSAYRFLVSFLCLIQVPAATATSYNLDPFCTLSGTFAAKNHQVGLYSSRLGVHRDLGTSQGSFKTSRDLRALDIHL